MRLSEAKGLRSGQKKKPAMFKVSTGDPKVVLDQSQWHCTAYNSLSFFRSFIAEAFNKNKQFKVFKGKNKIRGTNNWMYQLWVRR